MTRFRIPVAMVAVVAMLALNVSPAFAALTEKPLVAITFDDVPMNTLPLLDILQEKDAVATFFMVGVNAEEHPDLAQAVAAAGMPIGSHSYDHTDFTSASAAAIRANLTQAQNSIEAITGVRPTWYRSPYLSWSNHYTRVLPELGLKPSWPDVNPKDWNGVSAQQITNTILAGANEGCTVILHDMTDYTNTIEALPNVIDGLNSAGFDICVLDDLRNGGIAGTIRGAGGVPLKDATVKVYDAAGAVVGTAKSAADGTYRISRLSAPVGGTTDYRVGMTCQGYPESFYGGASTLAAATPITVRREYIVYGADIDPTRDSVPPVTTLTGTIPSGWTKGPVSFSLSATDELSSAGMKTWYRLGTGDPVRYTSKVTVTKQGAYDLEYWSEDGVGNVETRHVVSLQIDSTAPQTTTDGRASYAGAATINLSANDAHSGVATTYYSLDGAAAKAGNQVVVSTFGRHALRYWSVDNLGNREADRSLPFAVIASTKTTLAQTRTLGFSGFLPVIKTALTAKLELATGSNPLSGQTLRLEAKPSSSSVWSTVATGRTNGNGAVGFNVALRSGYQYRAVYAGKVDTYAASMSTPLAPSAK